MVETLVREKPVGTVRAPSSRVRPFFLSDLFPKESLGSFTVGSLDQRFDQSLVIEGPAVVVGPSGPDRIHSRVHAVVRSQKVKLRGLLQSRPVVSQKRLPEEQRRRGAEEQEKGGERGQRPWGQRS